MCGVALAKNQGGVEEITLLGRRRQGGEELIGRAGWGAAPGAPSGQLGTSGVMALQGGRLGSASATATRSPAVCMARMPGRGKPYQISQACRARGCGGWRHTSIVASALQCARRLREHTPAKAQCGAIAPRRCGRQVAPRSIAACSRLGPLWPLLRVRLGPSCCADPFLFPWTLPPPRSFDLSGIAGSSCASGSQSPADLKWQPHKRSVRWRPRGPQ